MTYTLAHITLSHLQKDRLFEEEKEKKKKLENLCAELNSKYEKEKQLLNEMTNHKKDLNETLINLEKQVRKTY
jgi:hypothetical protein